MTLGKMIHHSIGWLEGIGPFSELVLSSRVRLARNLALLPFPHRANTKQLQEILAQVKMSSYESNYCKDNLFLALENLSSLDRQFLIERHLISPDLAAQSREGGIIICDREIISIMINEEDHLRLQAILPGFQLLEAYRLINTLDDELSANLDYAFSEEWGYLTACPTNTGTGMRASVLIHLPALVLTKQIDKVLKGISQVGLAVRGLYGEGSEVIGNFFQISNQATLGRSEEDIIESLERVTRQIIEYETNARETILKSARFQVEDKIWRAYGILKNARMVTSEEVMNLTSALRLGVSTKVLDIVDIRTLNELLILAQPAHLQKLMGREMEPAERDFKRAELVRERLS